MKKLSSADRDALTRINEEIGSLENDGKWEALRDLLATQELRTGGTIPLLSFRRASGACVDARSFLDTVAKGGDRTTSISSIELEGDHIALVRCVVTTGEKGFNNVRVFIRKAPESTDWRLLAWANEAAPESRSQ
jgi:hypothetical protein